MKQRGRLPTPSLLSNGGEGRGKEALEDTLGSQGLPFARPTADGADSHSGPSLAASESGLSDYK